MVSQVYNRPPGCAKLAHAGPSLRSCSVSSCLTLPSPPPLNSPHHIWYHSTLRADDTSTSLGETHMLKSMLALVPLFAMAAPLAFGADDKAGGPLQFTVKDIDGKDVDLSQYKGKVVLMVNVASRCGNTPQYKQLEEMYSKYKDQGFVILGFPA